MSDLGDMITSLGPAIGVLLTTIALVGYLIAGIVALLRPQGTVSRAFMRNPGANIGVPCAALAAFALVGTLWKAFPPSTAGGSLQLKFMDLDFTGPSGPITLWIVSFLVLVVALRLMREP